jgi:hypothetical protein
VCVGRVSNGIVSIPLAIHRPGEVKKLLTPIQNYVHVCLCVIFTALNDDNTFAIRREGS